MMMICMALFALCLIAMFIGLFSKNSSIMWMGVVGVFVSFLGILIIPKILK